MTRRTRTSDLAEYGRLLVFTLLILIAGAQCAPATQIKVMTYNIHQMVGATAGYQSANAQSIARIINYYQPDVLTLDEVEGSNTSAALANVKQWCNNYISCFANLPDCCYYVSTTSDGYNRNAIISRYPIIDRVSYAMSPRDLLCGTIDLPGTADVRVFTAHFKADGDASSASTRQWNADTTEQKILTWSGDSSNAATPYVMCGDLNEDETKPQYPLSSTYHPISTVKEAYLNDCNPDSGWGNHYTISSSSPTRRFDYVLYSGRLKPRSRLIPSEIDNTIVCDTYAWFNHNQLPTGLGNHDCWGSDHMSVLETFDILDQTIQGIRQTPDGESIFLPMQLVTRKFADHFYIGDTANTVGIRVNSTADVDTGYLVNIEGSMSGFGTERAIDASSVRVISTSGTEIRPWGMRCKDVGGSDYGNVALGVDSPNGPYNIGLLVKLAGNVQSLNTDGFNLDDGSGCPVKIITSKQVTEGEFIVVTGIVAYQLPTGASRSIRVIEVENDTDINLIG